MQFRIAVNALAIATMRRCINDIHIHTHSGGVHAIVHTGYCITIIPLSILLFGFFFSREFQIEFTTARKRQTIIFCLFVRSSSLRAMGTRYIFAALFGTCAAQIEHSLCTMGGDCLVCLVF